MSRTRTERSRFPASLTALYAPLAVYGAVYFVTCVIGAAFVLFGHESFIRRYELHNGVDIPAFDKTAVAVNLKLLFIAPLLLAIGYVGGLQVPLRHFGEWTATKVERLARHDPPLAFAASLFLVLVFGSVLSLARAGTFNLLDAWLSYESFVAARAALFGELTFIEFVNIYVLMPTSAALVLVSVRGSGVATNVARFAPLLAAVLISLLLFQKKPALISLLVGITSGALFYGRRYPRLVRRTVGAGITLLVMVYFATVVLPVLPGVSRAPLADAAMSAPHHDVREVAVYTLLAPVSRTSVTALFYPTIYPREHPFYGLDVGQDLVGIGEFPDDNIVVWRAMHPDLAGTSAAPLQFVLYSQVGLVGALLGSLVAGLILSLAWRAARSTAWPAAISSVLGGLVMLLAVYFAIESLRNSLLVSYGLLWGFLYVAVVIALTNILPHGTRRARRGS